MPFTDDCLWTLIARIDTYKRKTLVGRTEGKNEVENKMGEGVFAISSLAESHQSWSTIKL